MSGRRSNVVEKVKATEAVDMSEEIEIENECEMLDGQETIEPVEHMITETENESVEISENGQVVEEKKVVSVSGSGRRRRRKQAVKSGNTEPVMNENILENEKPGEDDQEACFKIDKVYSVAGESDDLESYDKVQVDEKSVTIDTVQDEDITIQTVEEVIPNDHEEEAIVKVTTKKPEVKEESKEATDESKTKEEKQIQPRTLRATLAKVPPTLAAGGGVGSVRMLGGGVRGTNMPLIVSMGAGNPAIPLLPAGLPPGRYVILPGSSTTTTKTSTVTTMSSSMTPRLATSVATSGTQGLVAAQKTLAATPLAPPTTPPATVGEKIYTRERGRRKSYTAGEKLAMIRAVEGGQRKSAVADRFGVAPSTLASILAQKHKIRSEQDNLTRRRVRRYQLKDDAASRARVAGVHSSTSSMRLSPSTDHPFTHFLAPLSAPTPAVLDTQPEDIVAVPDLMERLASGGSGSDACKQESATDAEEDSREEETSFLEPESVLESTLLQEQPASKGKGFQQAANTSQPDADEPLSQDGQQRTSPTAGTSGLVGPYLLKKEAHCSTVLDQLMRDETFTDVTLTAEGQSLRAHRIVLCLASPYFRQVLSRELTVQSVVVLRDIKFSELRNIIHFIYTGEATVDASELESFMRTAEMLEIASLCEGQKSTSSRGPLSQNSYSSGFTIGDFERLVGTKRTKKEASPTPSKVRRLSGEGHSSRSSSTEPTATINPLSLIKEEPDCDNLFNDKSAKGINENTDALIEETQESERTRRDSGESVGGFAAIAGVQKSSSTDERTEDFSSIADSSPVPPVDDSAGQNIAQSLPDTTAVPGRCPYCPHLVQKFEGVAMMRHLLVSHPCKPAFPCDTCWRVFVKRAYFKSHQQKCQQSLC
ncbi:hypothetical protein O3P69_007937 [Scylla paramamosain]|uniref:BTB domain-containing protein n=1 Tax=Scylla paramamosain TaxID=85552 RepID=A0AAW0SZ12_SCYPA